MTGNEFAAVAATLIAGTAAFAQVHRVTVEHDRAGVSATRAFLGVVTELTWIAYLVGSRLWWALPESALLAVANVIVLGAVTVRRSRARRSWCAAAVWPLLIVATALTTGGFGAGFVLMWSYVVQVAPAVWTAWTTIAPSGVVGVSWVLTAVEGALWGWYGLAVGDRALSTFAALTIVAALLMLGRKAAVCVSARDVLGRRRIAS